MFLVIKGVDSGATCPGSSPPSATYELCHPGALNKSSHTKMLPTGLQKVLYKFLPWRNAIFYDSLPCQVVPRPELIMVLFLLCFFFSTIVANSVLSFSCGLSDALALSLLAGAHVWCPGMPQAWVGPGTPPCLSHVPSNAYTFSVNHITVVSCLHKH